jgi:replicative DNA helicase
MSKELNAYEMVIGGLINKPEWMTELAASMSPQDFNSKELSTIADTLVILSDANAKIDLPILLAHLDEKMHGYVHEIASKSVTLNENAWKSLLKKCTTSIVKQRIELGSAEILSQLRNEQITAEEALTQIGELKEASDGKLSGALSNTKSYSDCVKMALQDMQDMALGKTIKRVTTGLHDLDEMILGFEPGDLVILGARPSMGKTAFSMKVVENAAINNLNSLVFSVEMQGKDLAMRSIASIGGINYQNLRKGQLTELEKAKMKEAIPRIKALSIIVDDSAGLTMSQLESTAIREHKKKKLGMIMLDYLQLLSFADMNESSQTLRVGEASRRLKKLGKNLGVPIIVLSQLNRALEQRPDKRPINSDLRDSGNIEQDADIILFLYRDEVYNEDTADKGIAEIIIGKQRNGPIGKVYARFLGHQSRFENISKVSEN